MKVRATVISCDGWSWVLAWAQLGVTDIVCYPLMPIAQEQLSPLVHLFSNKLSIVNSWEECCSVATDVVSFHVHEASVVPLIISALQPLQPDGILLCSGKKTALDAFGEMSDLAIHTANIHHRRLGGSPWLTCGSDGGPNRWICSRANKNTP
jgi:hypothetical protein